MENHKGDITEEEVMVKEEEISLTEGTETEEVDQEETMRKTESTKTEIMTNQDTEIKVKEVNIVLEDKTRESINLKTDSKKRKDLAQVLHLYLLHLQ